jgi:hypothetical protein
MALNLGLDNRRLLPPFLPVQRNQDGVFGALVRTCCDGGYFGFLPWTVLHGPPAARPFDPADPWKGVAGVQSGHIIQVLVRSFASGPDKADTAKNLRTLGTALVEWGSAPWPEFAELVRLRLWGQFSKHAVHVEGLLRKFGGQPAFWAQDAKQFLTALRKALPDPQYVAPVDLAEAFGADQAGERLQRLVRRFGQLLQCWPDMAEAAKELRARGVRLAVAP